MVGGIAVGSMEGLTGDNNGRFYVADRTTDVCNVWEIDTNTALPSKARVGNVGAAGCRPSGLTLDANGDLFITTAGGGGVIYTLTPNAGDPTGADATGKVYATGVPGANGVAFLGNDLFVTDGTANKGFVWKIDSCTTFPAVPCAPVEFLRVPPRRNGTADGGNVLPANQPDGVGTVRYTVPRHQLDPDLSALLPLFPPTTAI